MNLPEIIQALEMQRAKDLEEDSNESHQQYDFLI